MGPKGWKKTYMGFLKSRYPKNPKNRWLIMENPIKMADLGVYFILPF
jgi:hypothetical protein